ncbi:MAG: hypothetical protein QOD07_1685 [Frankiaceae bacterium]|jgi:uncharacterized repeat protein (TIGR01451 family)|nr:hypothetical protein [Frankiaceae bacterium]
MRGHSRRLFSGITALVLVLMWLPAALLSPAQASGGTFEIDGNKVVDTAGNLDWNSPAVGNQPVENDNAGGDPTVYSASSKESNDPSTWTLAGGAPPKDDMTNIYAYAEPNSANVFFGFDRGATSGTDSYYLELNKLQPTDPTTYAPVRSEGDLRFRLDDKGSGVIALSSESVWTNGAWVVTTLSSNPTGFDYAVSADESFLEFSFDLTTLLNLKPACPPLFGSLGFRNVTGETGENLKDFIKPVKLSAGSTCGQLKIVKHDGAGALLGGATFRITPDPRPIVNPAAYLDVVDNGPYDTDPADGQVTVDPATPGDYHVTEHAAPGGYFVDATDALVTVPSAAANSPVPVFVDAQGTITVHKKTAGSAALGHSTFQLLDHATQAVVDTVADTDGDGTLVFSDVAPGTYDLHESVTPQGYDAAANVTGIVVDQDHQSVSVDVHDAQHETSLTVHKTDTAGTTPIAGATFDLWVESNGVTGLQTAASGGHDADTKVAFTCTTGATGFCTTNYTHATWPNQYYWKETGVPWPFTVPDAPDDVFAVQPITSANVTTTLFTVEVHDPMASLGTVASPSTTVASPLALNPTATIGDQATISGIQQAATGTLDFYLYKTGQACDPAAPDASKQVGSAVPVSGPGTYPATPVTTTVTTAGIYHWLAVLHIGTDALPGSCTDTGEQVIVGKATPTLTTQATDTGTVDGTVSDTAHLRDFASTVTGEKVHFALYTSPGCTDATPYWPTTASDGDVALDANGDATSPAVAVDGTHDTYYWKVTYAADANNTSASESCGTVDNNEISHAPLIPNPVKAPASGVVSVDGPNNTISYTITVQNTGSATATGVVITEPASGASADPSVNVFDKATYDNDAACGTGTSAGCAGSIDVTGGVITWTTDIAAKGSATVTFSVTVKPTDGDGDHIYNQASVTSGQVTRYSNVTDHVVKYPEIRVTKASDPLSGSSTAPAPVSPGDDITYTLTVYNDGLADATAVPVSDAVPTGTEYVQGSADATGGTFDSGSNTVSWSVDVTAGHSVDVSFKAHVVATDANGTPIDNTGTFTNTHTATADCLDPAQNQCHTNTTYHVVEFPVLALAKTADPASGSIVQRGDSIGYTITVSNSGLAAAHGVSVVDTLPANVTLDESSVTPTEASNSNGKLTWQVDVPAAQDGVDGVTTITYTVTVNADAPEGTTLTNAVLIDGECPGAAQGSDPCTTDHHVPTGDLTLVKHVDKTSASYGDTLTYTFDAATTGDLDQTNVVVTDVVPNGTTYVDNSAGCTDAGTCTTAYDAATRTVSWQLGDIAHGAPARTLVFKVTIDKPGFDPTVGLPLQTVTNSGVIVSGETAATPSNEVKTTVIQVLGIKVVRKPPTLPFTGAGLPPVTAVAIASLLIAVGATMVGARRRED